MKKIGFVLHSHLPYLLGHGTWPHGVEWLYEAACETYIPLLRVFKRLKKEGIPFGVTINFTPVLSEQLKDERFKKGFIEYLESKIEFAKKDLPLFGELAKFWLEFYEGVLREFEEEGRDIAGAMRELQEDGVIEILTSAATHGYLPLLGFDESVKGQVKEGVRSYKKNFGKEPSGIWPPELGYRPSYIWAPHNGMLPPRKRKGLEEVYQEEGIKFFLVDAHLLKGGKPIGTYLSLFEGLKILWEQSGRGIEMEEKELSPYSIYLASSDGIALPFFTRDPETALQVWSKDCGYPGDANYLEFHKKHFPGGLRYWRITSPSRDLGEKDLYHPEWAEDSLRKHAEHFVSLLSGIKGELVIAPYDTELFGHWWFEGPEWLYLVIKKIHEHGMGTATLSRILEENPPSLVLRLPEGSWGEGGFHWVWLNEWTEWTWRHIYECEKKFFGMAGKIKGELKERILKQLARELLLLQSSDWQFLITTWSARDYAERRFCEHLENFERLYSFLEKESLSAREVSYLEELESRNSLFPDINPHEWLSSA
ncbi:1,4-alpha-glucan branching protein [bacterium]|nr:MAG: 1,4-alpha-glucan branching protein [bacterium]